MPVFFKDQLAEYQTLISIDISESFTNVGTTARDHRGTMFGPIEFKKGLIQINQDGPLYILRSHML